jgi:hypothetical protein
MLHPACWLQVQPHQRSKARLCKMLEVMSGGRMCYASEPTLVYQVLVCLRPGWDKGFYRYPVGIGGFVTPFHKTRHTLRVRFGAAKMLHSPLAFPQSQRPERATCIEEESPAEEPGCAHNLALTEKGIPHELREIPQGAKAKTGDRCEHV